MIVRGAADRLGQAFPLAPRALPTTLWSFVWTLLRAGRAQCVGQTVQRKKAADAEYQVNLFHEDQVGIVPACVKMGAA